MRPGGVIGGECLSAQRSASSEPLNQTWAASGGRRRRPRSRRSRCRRSMGRRCRHSRRSCGSPTRWSDERLGRAGRRGRWRCRGPASALEQGRRPACPSPGRRARPGRSGRPGCRRRSPFRADSAYAPGGRRRRRRRTQRRPRGPGAVDRAGRRSVVGRGPPADVHGEARREDDLTLLPGVASLAKAQTGNVATSRRHARRGSRSAWIGAGRTGVARGVLPQESPSPKRAEERVVRCPLRDPDRRRMPPRGHREARGSRQDGERGLVEVVARGRVSVRWFVRVQVDRHPDAVGAGWTS